MEFVMDDVIVSIVLNKKDVKISYRDRTNLGYDSQTGNFSSGWIDYGWWSTGWILYDVGKIAFDRHLPEYLYTQFCRKIKKHRPA
jgi:hypothetical protein